MLVILQVLGRDGEVLFYSIFSDDSTRHLNFYLSFILGSAIRKSLR